MNAYRAGLNKPIFIIYMYSNNYICAYNLITTVYDMRHLHILSLGTRYRFDLVLLFFFWVTNESG